MEAEYDGADIGRPYLLAPPFTPPKRTFRGRDFELRRCFAAWGLDRDGRQAKLESTTGEARKDALPLNFRLEGPPGVGKNEIVYELSRRLALPLFVIQGHEEITPEDLALVLVPDTRNGIDRKSVV